MVFIALVMSVIMLRGGEIGQDLLTVCNVLNGAKWDMNVWKYFTTKYYLLAELMLTVLEYFWKFYCVQCLILYHIFL